MRKRKIILPHGGRTKLAKDYRTTYVTVNSALSFKTNSKLAKRIRAAALVRGGYQYEEIDCESEQADSRDSCGELTGD